jgi:glycosyltransferase involved in cell wall biosynthesis
MSQLAIIIPAYRAQYFEKALASLAVQTNKNFKVYVGDDHSPDDLEIICNKFSADLNIQYIRFENNIGAKNLVNQWNRCVSLSSGEEWLWLFADDDIADTLCVENFFRHLEITNDRFDVYRFNTVVIDGEDKIIKETGKGPDSEDSAEMAYHLLLGKRGNCMPDHIFSRRVYEKNGGFVFTQYAQAADWATSILFAKEKGISIIPNAKLYWRVSGSNVSSIASQKNGMLQGYLQFVEWLLLHFQYLKQTHGKITYNMVTEAAKINLRNVIVYHYKGFDFRNGLKLFKFFRKKFKLSNRQALMELLWIKEHTVPVVKKILSKLVIVKKKFSAFN